MEIIGGELASNFRVEGLRRGGGGTSPGFGYTHCKVDNKSYGCKHGGWGGGHAKT